jgi:hypothetical protein
MFKSNSSRLELVWCELFKLKYEFASVMIGAFAKPVHFYSLILKSVHFLNSLQNWSTFIAKSVHFHHKVDRFCKEFEKWTDFRIRLQKRTDFAIVSYD